jgi:hypothetical protein
MLRGIIRPLKYEKEVQSKIEEVNLVKDAYKLV